jgi:hypothetical protein
LKDNDDDDQDYGPKILENPAGDEEAGPAGHGVKDPEGYEGNEDSKRPSSLDPDVQPVKNEGDEKDIDDILPPQADQGFPQILNLPTSEGGLVFIIL